MAEVETVITEWLHSRGMDDMGIEGVDLIDALAESGHVVVKLPERRDDGWEIDRHDEDFRVTPVHLVDRNGAGMTGCAILWGQLRLNLKPGHTRRLAAALLAALAAAESGETR